MIRHLVALAGAAAVAALAAAPAAASPGAGGRPAQAASQPSIAITSVTPNIARAGPKTIVVVSGTITNPTSTPLAGLSVQLWSSPAAIGSRAGLTSYLDAAGPTGIDTPVTGATQTMTAPLAAHSSQAWSVTLRVSQVGMSAFGVYPLAAQLNGLAGPLAVSRTFLPFWPGKAGRKSLRPLNIAWVWPLIDTPQQAACPALLSNELATSVAGQGRLNRLLTAGASPDGRKAQLTWAIDPALLSDASVMTRPYLVGGNATCRGSAHEPASSAAQAWLNRLHTVASQQDYFVTPYADVDVAALAHRGLDSELATAFSDGRAEASRVLGHPQRVSTGGRAASIGGIAWPAEGIADLGVLGGLATNQIGTVVLDSTMMPPVTPASGLPGFTPSAVTTTPNGLGSQLHVLLADNTLSQILADRNAQIPTGTLISTASPSSSPAAAAAPPQATAFAREQWFLAETAMIAESPATSRSVVVTPPRRWNPGAAVARGLLADTVNAPWLHPASLASLISARHQPGQVRHQQPRHYQVNADELRGHLLRQIKALGARIRLQGSILSPPDRNYLSTAVAAVESSAWRGDRASQAKAESLVHRLSAYVSAQLRQVRIIDQQRVTLGGKSGSVPVSISNQLKQPVTVQLRVSAPSGEQVSIGKPITTVTVDAGTQQTIKIPVRAAVAGTTTLTLRLATPDGRLLPGTAVQMTVEATHFGTLALVIIGIALVVFVLTTATRAIRRGGGTADDDTGDLPEAEPGEPESAYADGEADTVEPERADDDHPAKEPDDHASTPGWADRR